ncbi:MAG: sigma-54 interaction domain-containing protein [Pygmaiobacter massiliensis]
MFYDVLLMLNSEKRIVSLRWKNDSFRNLYHLLFENWVTNNRKATSVFPLPSDRNSGTVVWDKETFQFQMLPAPHDSFYLLLSKKDYCKDLFVQALDQISEGVQIYDKDACVVYFNKASRIISHIPSDINPEGNHLLDLYNLDESISTTMTALRTQAPVINRVDHFLSSDNNSITTANTSYPIIKKGELLGAVVFEQTEDIVQKNMRRMEATQKALKAFSSCSKEITFPGYSFQNVIGNSSQILSAVAVAKKIAVQNSSVLLVGETGTGKEIFAQSIHRASPRHKKRFLAINCAAIPETLIESLLFGTQKGSFTGSENKMGYFEEAAGGTLFLDELNSMSLSMQSKILRAIQENTFRRVGGSKDLPLDVRIISSCNEDPFRTISQNQLRKDLFYRLSTVMIELPPLREHLDDLEELVEYHLNATAYQYVHGTMSVSPEVYKILRAYEWPGNVRELFHVLDYAQNVADSDKMCPEHLPAYILKNNKALPDADLKRNVNEIDFSVETLQSLLDSYEHQVLLQALEYCGYNISRTADVLGVLRQSLQYRIRKYGIVL